MSQTKLTIDQLKSIILEQVNLEVKKLANKSTHTLPFRQKYIVQCIRAVTASRVGLGNRGLIKKGDFITEFGAPTRDPNKAAIYSWKEGNDFPFEQEMPAGSLKEFFRPVPVSILPLEE